MVFNEWYKEYARICQVQRVRPAEPNVALWSFDDQLTPAEAVERLMGRIERGSKRGKDIRYG